MRQQVAANSVLVAVQPGAAAFSSSISRVRVGRPANDYLGTLPGWVLQVYIPGTPIEYWCSRVDTLVFVQSGIHHLNDTAPPAWPAQAPALVAGEVLPRLRFSVERAREAPESNAPQPFMITSTTCHALRHRSHTTEPGNPARPTDTFVSGSVGHRNPQLASIPLLPRTTVELLAFHAPPNRPVVPRTTKTFCAKPFVHDASVVCNCVVGTHRRGYFQI